MPQAELTGADLLDEGLTPTTTAERLRGRILDEVQRLQQEQDLPRSEAVRELFPDVVLEQEPLDVLVTSLLSGSNVMVLGPPGSGKTTLAKAVWDLFPKERMAVADCPVHDDPFSLIDPVFASRVPPCPYCQANHGGVSWDELGGFDPEEVEPSDVPVRRVRLREGHGFARVQGSPEVFPDNLTGSINLSRLEEVGDPTSPLVFQPGKLLQAHRGVLLVDEVGKLPRGTQNVLLQALQEGIVSPAKSRETFPADLIAVCTSNLADLANITEPLNDRLSNIHTPFPQDPGANRRIVDVGLRYRPAPVHVQGPYRDGAVRLVMRWRARMEGHRELSEVGSNRTLLDIVQRTGSYALLHGSDRVDPDDFHRGARDAMVGRIRARSEDGFAENRDLVEAFLEEHWRASATEGARDYWCRFFTQDLSGDEAEGTRVVGALRSALGDNGSTDHLLRLMRQEGDQRVRAFGRYVQRAEGVDRQRAAELLPLVFETLDELGTFDGGS